MKNKILKIWGLVMVVAILAGLLVPAMPAAAANSLWSSVPTPNVGTTSNVLIAAPAGNAWVMDVGLDGKTIVAYDNSGVGNFYKSTNGGSTFSGSSSIGVGLDGVATLPVTAIKISSDFANDNTIIAATATQVFRSADGGATFGIIGTIGTTAGMPLAGNITAVDVGPQYNGGQAVLVSTSNGAGGGGASRLLSNTFNWSTLGFNGDVLSVAFSPKYRQDAEVVAVSSNATGTFLVTKFANDNPNVGVAATPITNATNALLSNYLLVSASTTAVIAFPGDYDWSGNNRIFVGLGDSSGAAIAADDVYRVNGVLPPGLPQNAVDLNANGTGNSVNVSSLSFKGLLTTGYLYVGQQNTPSVLSGTGMNANSPTFTTPSKSPTGTVNTRVEASQVDADTNIFALTSGMGSAFSVSTDNALNFNQTSLISVSANLNVHVVDLTMADANTMYLILWDDRDGSLAYSAGDTTSLFMSANAGTNWAGIFPRSPAAGTDGMNQIYLSPAYATDKTLYVTQTDSRIWKSSNAGLSFIGLSTPNSGNIAGFAPIDGSNYFVGTNNNTPGIYKSGSYTVVTLPGATVSTLTYISATDMYAGATNGNVYRSTNGGVSFSQVGTAAVGTGLPVLSIIVDPSYATNNLIYVANADGTFRWNTATSALWTTLNSTPVTSIQISGDGTIYTTTNTATAALRCTAPSSPGPALFDGINYTAANLPSTSTGATAVNTFATGTAAAPNNTIYIVLQGFGSTTSINDKIYTYQDTLVAAPAVSFPAANAQVPISGNMQWTPVTTAAVPVTYTVQIGTDAVFSGFTSFVTTGTQAPYGPLNPGQDYYWRVRVTGVGAPAAQQTSKYSAVTKFSILLAQPGNDLSVLGLYGPTAGATDVPVKPVFQWSAVLNAQSYDLQVADNPVFVNPLDAQTGLNTTVWTETKTLDPGKTYYWRVRAVSATGVASSWVAGSFTTALPPTTPVTTTAPPPVTITTTLPPVTTTVSPAPKFFDPNSGLYFNSQSELQQYQAAHPANQTTTPATPAYIWVIIVIGAILVIAVIVLIVRTRKV